MNGLSRQANILAYYETAAHAHAELVGDYVRASLNPNADQESTRQTLLQNLEKEKLPVSVIDELDELVRAKQEERKHRKIELTQG